MNAISQKTSEKTPKKTISSQIAKSISKNLSQIETNPRKHLTTEVIIDHFIKEERAALNCVNYPLNNKAATFSSESLMNMSKKFIDSFIVQYNESKPDYDFDDALKSGAFKNIYENLETAKQKGLKNLNNDQLKKNLDSIKSLPNSIEKIELLLIYGRVYIPVKTYYDEAISICDIGESSAGLIADLYQRAIAYMEIGSFAEYYQIDDRAVRLYYLARENLDNSKEDMEDRNYEQGTICESLADIFSDYEGVGNLKSYNYSTQASNYFRDGKDAIERTINDLESIVNEYNLSSDIAMTNLYTGSSKLHEQNLNELNYWYDCYRNGLLFDDESNYLGFYAIAQNLMTDSSYNEALMYYWSAFFYAANGTNKDCVSSLLSNISDLYAVLGKEKLSMECANLDFYLQEKTYDSVEMSNCFLTKANAFKDLKKYDSSLLYLNKMQFDTGLKNICFRPDYENFQETIFGLKKEIFKSLKIYDSANFYEKKFLNSQSQDLQTISNLVEVESEAIGGYLNRARKKTSESEVELKNILGENVKIQVHIVEAKNETNRLSKLRDSLATANLTNSSKNAIKLDSANAKTDQQKLINEQQKKLNKQNEKFWISVVIASILFLSTLFFIITTKIEGRRRKAETIVKEEEIKRIEAEKNALRFENEKNQLNELARNKIHNFRSDITDIDNLVKENSPLLNKYMEAYKVFLKLFLHNWQEKKISLYEDLEELRSYIKVKQVGKNINYIERISVSNPEEILFLQSVFDTLLDNSVKWGFKEKTEDCQFIISLQLKENFLICEITDNGKPSSIDRYFSKEKKGLVILRKRISIFYDSLSRKYDPDYFVVEILPDEKGTYIKLTLPYEKT